MELEQAAQEPHDEQQVLAPVGQRLRARLGLGDRAERSAISSRSVATLARVAASPTRSAISRRISSSLLTGVKRTGVAAHSRSASRPLSVSV